MAALLFVLFICSPVTPLSFNMAANGAHLILLLFKFVK